MEIKHYFPGTGQKNLDLRKELATKGIIFFKQICLGKVHPKTSFDIGIEKKQIGYLWEKILAQARVAFVKVFAWLSSCHFSCFW